MYSKFSFNDFRTIEAEVKDLLVTAFASGSQMWIHNALNVASCQIDLTPDILDEVRSLAGVD